MSFKAVVIRDPTSTLGQYSFRRARSVGMVEYSSHQSWSILDLPTIPACMNVLCLYGVRMYVSDVDMHIVGTSSGWREDRLGGTYI